MGTNTIQHDLKPLFMNNQDDMEVNSRKEVYSNKSQSKVNTISNTENNTNNNLNNLDN